MPLPGNASCSSTLLYHWARRRLSLQAQDAADLVQGVFTHLVRKLPEFSYDPRQRFRGWLWTVTRNLWRSRFRRASAEPCELRPDNLEAPDNVAELAEEEYRHYLSQRALRLMQAEFEPATWKACWETVVCGRPAAEVAAELGMTPNGVYIARCRVLQRLREELRGLLE